eukprot:16714-Chlamydomonas_euryale.AAC.1
MTAWISPAAAGPNLPRLQLGQAHSCCSLFRAAFPSALSSVSCRRQPSCALCKPTHPDRALGKKRQGSCFPASRPSPDAAGRKRPALLRRPRFLPTMPQ